MNALIRWDPFKEMDELQSQFAQVFGLTPARLGKGGQELMTITEWVPSVDIVEDEKEYVVKAELPELKKEDVKVTVENGVLTITGERRFEKDEKEQNFQRIERMYGSFTRSFTLPNTVDPEQVSAHYEKGVLGIRLAKKAEAKPKLIKVNVEKTLEVKSPGKVA